VLGQPTVVGTPAAVQFTGINWPNSAVQILPATSSGMLLHCHNIPWHSLAQMAVIRWPPLPRPAPSSPITAQVCAFASRAISSQFPLSFAAFICCAVAPHYALSARSLPSGAAWP